MIPTKMSEARQTAFERRKIDRGEAPLSFELSCAANVYVAVDRRIAGMNTLPAWLMSAEWEPVADEVVCVSLEACGFMVLFHRVASAGVVRLGTAGLPNMEFLPHLVFVSEL